jgi:uncharacterized membrane protein (UPF0127 family)
MDAKNVKKRQRMPKQIQIGSHNFRCNYALTSQERSEGMQVYSSCPEDCALVFPFNSIKERSFAMKDVKFPLDIIFVINGTIAKICHNIQPGNEKTFTCKCDIVIEVSGGVCGELGITRFMDVRI